MKIIVLGIIMLFSSFISTAQVNLQSGSAEQNFQLINYADSKAGLALNIGVAYSSGNGLLVNDIASNLGTGWNLDAGGIIIRVQNGEPDDQIEYNTGIVSAEIGNVYGEQMALRNYPNGYLYNNFVGQGCNVGLNYYPSFKHQSVYKELNVVNSDVEQDKFIFKINGHSGVFVIGRNKVPTILGDSRIKVSFSESNMTGQGIRTTINQFSILTEDGIKYTFSEKSLSRICRYKYSKRDNAGNWYPVNGNASDDPYVVNRYWGYELQMNERPFVVNSWFLSQIENTNSGEKIFLNYQTITNNVVAAKLVNHQRDLNNSGRVRGLFANRDRKKNGRNWYNYLSNPANASYFSWNTSELNRLKAGSTSLLYNRSIIESKRISTINFPNGGLVSFIYSDLPRADLPGEHALDQIEYSINGKLIRKYLFSYQYFFKNSLRPYKSSFSSFEAKFARLCLKSIQKIGNNIDNANEPPYMFNYFTGSSFSADDIVPARNYLSQDHWGFYNGSNAELSLSEDHDFLSQEGTSYFKTVLPQYKNPKSGYAKNGLLRSVIYPTGGSLEYTYSQIIPSQNILPSQYQQMAGGVSVIKTVLFDGEDPSKNIVQEYNYKNSVNQSTHWGDEKPSYTNFSITEFNLKCFNGKSYKYPGLQFSEMATSIDWGKILGKALIGASINIAASVAFQLLLPASILPIVNIIVFAATIVKFIIDCTKTFEYHRFLLSNVNNINSNPLLSYFSMVEVRSNSPSGGYNGKTVYEFTNLIDYPALVPKLEWPYIQNQRLASWIYGNPKKVTMFDKDGQKVNESHNMYNNLVFKLNDNNNYNCKCATVNKEAIKSSDWKDYEKAYFTRNSYNWLTPRPYFITTGRSDLISSTENSYTNGSLYASNNTNFLIDPMTLLQKGKIIMKDVNSLVIQLTYFPTDFNIPNSAMERLKQINAIHVPVSTETWILKVDPSQTPSYQFEMLSANVTEFKKYTFGSRLEVKPWKIYQLKAKSPLPLSVIGTHNSSVLLRNPNYYKLQSEMVYDINGNLVQTIEDGNITSFINDYNERHKVASVAIATYTDIAYTSFESNGKGNWIFNASAIQNNIGLTGKRSYLISTSNTISKTSLDASKTYIVTYWAKEINGSSVQINGSSGQMLFQTGEWQLFTHTISSTSTVTLSGYGEVDELRLYPEGALMSTTTYEEGVGKIADCDANNRLLFYEYDALGRLKLIKDQNFNVIKTYEYNYKR